MLSTELSKNRVQPLSYDPAHGRVRTNGKRSARPTRDHSTPSAGVIAFQQLTPAGFSHRFHSRGKGNITSRIARVNSPPRNFLEFPADASPSLAAPHRNVFRLRPFRQRSFAWSRPPRVADEESR